MGYEIIKSMSSKNYNMMRALHIVMPMAGEGSRFLKEGWNTPKPLIELNGVPLFIRAIGSVKSDDIPLKYSFIVRKEHIDTYQIDEKIRTILPEANIFSVLKTTRGAVETCLLAESVIAEEDAIIVMDCDLEFSSRALMENIKSILAKPVDKVNGGLLVSFESDQPKYSYAEVNENGIVKRTAEKEVISSNALCGSYFFSSAKDFLRVSHEFLDDVSFNKSEFYVSLLYNYLLREGQVVKLCPMEKYFSYGTPDELKRYL